MDQVRELQPDDVAALPPVHLAAFGPMGHTPDEIRVGYEQKFGPLFLDQFDDQHAAPSLVYEVDGEIVGYIGVIARPVLFEGKRVWAATTSHFAVSPEARGSLAAVHLLRAVFDGDQDLTYVDRSKPVSRRALTAAGAEAFPAYSLRWEKRLRPMEVLSKKVAGRLPRGGANVVAAARRFEGRLPASLRDRAVAELPDAPAFLTAVELTVDRVVEAGPGLVSDYALHPDFSDRELVEWQWGRLELARPNSTRARAGLANRRGELVGWYIVDIDANDIARVVQLVAGNQHHHAVLLHLLNDMAERGVVSVRGDATKELFYLAEELGCSLSSVDATTIVHSKNDRIVDAFRTSNAFLTALEGEFLMNPALAVPR